jgi:hypothetical protein
MTIFRFGKAPENPPSLRMETREVEVGYGINTGRNGNELLRQPFEFRDRKGPLAYENKGFTEFSPLKTTKQKSCS